MVIIIIEIFLLYYNILKKNFLKTSSAFHSYNPCPFMRVDSVKSRTLNSLRTRDLETGRFPSPLVKTENLGYLQRVQVFYFKIFLFISF